jgi:hypothetical protein
VYDKTKTKSSEEMKKLIKLGIKCFIGVSDGSAEVLDNIAPLLEEHPDVLYFNSMSTAVLDLPKTIIRTAVNDNVLCYNLLTQFLPNMYNLLTLGGHTNATPLSGTPITKICYIYEPGVYTTGFLGSLETANEALENPYIINSYSIQNEESIPTELIDLLTSNPVDSTDFIDSSKTVFIVNSSLPQDLMNKFTDQTYTNNYFIFGDPYFTEVTTDLTWEYSFCLCGNFSTLGYKFSKFVDPTQNMSPLLLGVVDIIHYFACLYLNAYKSGSSKILDKLINIEYLVPDDSTDTVDAHRWFMQQEQLYNMANSTDDDKTFTFSLSLSSKKYNPTMISVNDAKHSKESVTADEGSSYRDYQNYLLRKIGELISLNHDLYDVLIILYYDTRNAPSKAELYTINAQVDDL